jgi:hypothetical protein
MCSLNWVGWSILIGGGAVILYTIFSSISKETKKVRRNKNGRFTSRSKRRSR